MRSELAGWSPPCSRKAHTKTVLLRRAQLEETTPPLE